MAADLTATIAPSPTFSLSADAAGVENEYVADAKNGVLTVLMSQGFTPVLDARLTSQTFGCIQSIGPTAFYIAAKEATEKLLGMVPGFEQHRLGLIVLRDAPGATGKIRPGAVLVTAG